MSKPKLIVTGASGLLGREIMKKIKEADLFDVIGIVNTRYKDNLGLLKCDLLQSGILDILKQLDPDVIVHSAAERFPDKIEKDYEKAKELNVDLPEKLAKYSFDNEVRFIFISTDYIFDGTSPPYSHSDTPNPLNKYGQSKYEGEKAVLHSCPNATILRIPLLYGPVEYIEESAVSCLLIPLLDRKSVCKISHYEKRYPSHVADIARIIYDLLRLMKKGNDISGIYQWSGKEQLTKYEMVMMISKVFDLRHEHVVPLCSSSPGALRPYDSQMSNSRLELLGISHHTSFSDGVQDSLKSWVEKFMNIE